VLSSRLSKSLYLFDENLLLTSPALVAVGHAGLICGVDIGVGSRIFIYYGISVVELVA
jgi:hypothetical protein